MKYLKKFEKTSDYEAFKGGGDWLTPNVSYITNDNLCKYSIYTQPQPINLCDIAYWNGSQVKTIAKDKYSTDLGTAIGVVVIPSGMLPDGKARMIGLKPIDENGNASNKHVVMTWGGYGTNTSLNDYGRVPTTDNADFTSNGFNSEGYLPSVAFTGATSFVDGKAKYKGKTPFIPSPYLGDDKTMNPEYSKVLEGNNVLSDFNGLSNTQTLVGLGIGYTPANAAYKYKDGVSNVQWYLPAMGELGFIVPRLNDINATIRSVGGVIVYSNYWFWSSSEYSAFDAYYLDNNYGGICAGGKDNGCCVRLFGVL